MDLKEFGMAILQYFIANIPTLVAILFYLVSKFKEINSEVETFGFKVNTTENNIVDKIDKKVNNILDVVDKRFETTIDKVDKTLENTLNKVDSFANELHTQKIQIENLFKTNKVSLEIIGLLIGKDEKLVESGVASIIVNKLNLTKEELEKYPELVSNDKDLLEKVIREQYAMLGKENFEEIILRVVGDIYG